MKNTDSEMDDLEPALKKSKKWIETTDRGGLCYINNCAYRLFESVECACYPILMENFDNLARRSVQTIALITSEDTDLQYLWSTVAKFEAYQFVIRWSSRSFTASPSAAAHHQTRTRTENGPAH